MPPISSTKKIERVAFVCRTCGSEDVFADAWASWDKVGQRWELASTYDAAYCNRCGEECKLDSKTIPETPHRE